MYYGENIFSKETNMDSIANYYLIYAFSMQQTRHSNFLQIQSTNLLNLFEALCSFEMENKWNLCTSLH